MALYLIRLRTPKDFIKHKARYSVEYNPSKVEIDRKLAKTCVKLMVDPTKFVDLPNSIQQSIENLSKLEKIDKALRTKFRRKLSFYHLWEANEGKCYISNEPLEFDEATRDHVFPQSLGFYRSHNYMPASRVHNKAKGNNWPTLVQIYRTYRTYRRLGRWFYPTTRKNKPLKWGPFLLGI